MLTLVCSIFAFVVGFCAGSMRSLETPEVKRLNKIYWDTQALLDETEEANKLLKSELTKVKLELLKLQKQIAKESSH